MPNAGQKKIIKIINLNVIKLLNKDKSPYRKTMKTKIVYVLVSSVSDIYLEQALVSAYSCRHYNPDTKIIFTVDSDTYAYIKQSTYPELKSCIDEYVCVPDLKNMSNKEKSRWIKTNLGKIIPGDFLYIDTDTIVTDNLSEIDMIDSKIALVKDIHSHLIGHPFESYIRATHRKYYNEEIPPGTNYYNSGAILVRESEDSKKFFEIWHSNWISTNKEGGVFDQISLTKTIMMYQGDFSCLDDIYNTQVLGSIKFLVKGKILHFFNTNWARGDIHPFLKKETFNQIKDVNHIPQTIIGDIINCKTIFSEQSMIIGPSACPVVNSQTFMLMLRIKNTKLFSVINWVSYNIIRILRFLHK